MYYSKINKAKTFKGLCLLLIIFILSDVSIAQQKLTYGNYPVLRGSTNPQEIIADYDIDDAGKYLRQAMLSANLKAWTIKNSEFKPNETLTNLDAIRAISNLTNEIEKSNLEKAEDEKYAQIALDLGLVKEEQLKKDKQFFQKKINIRQLNDYFSKLLKVQTKYNESVNKPATRLDFSNMVYDNKEQILKNKNIDFYSGRVISKSEIVENGKNKTLITVKLDKGIVIKKDEENDKKNDKDKTNYIQNQIDKIIPDNKDDSTTTSYLNIISQNDVVILTPFGFTTDINNIVIDSQLNIYSKNNTTLYIEQHTVPTTQISAVFESIIIDDKKLIEDEKVDKTLKNTTDTIKIKDYDDKTHIYKLHNDVKILQSNGEIGETTKVTKPISKEQLSYGQDISLIIRNNVVTQITAYVPVEEELNAYVQPESQLMSGTVLDINENSVTLTNNKNYTISSDTIIMKDGQIGDYGKIKDGDRIKLFFDDIYSNIPSKIEVEGDQKQTDKIVKAKVGAYSISKKSLTLKDIKELENGVWIDKDEKAYDNVKIKGNIYANSSKIKSNRLKNYNNQEIYAVFAKNQGIPTIEKAKIRLGDSLKFENAVKNIDHSQNTLEIDGNLVKFDNSTIIIKDGRLVQPSNLEQNINSNIETNMLKTAQIIVQTGSDLNINNVNTYPYKIYRASLRDVFDYSILLGNDIENGKKVNHYLMWQGGVWNRLSEGSTTPRLQFTEQTNIYDHDNNKKITVDEMREKQYATNTFGIRPQYFNRQVYVVTKDNVVLSIDFVKSQGYVQVNSQNTIVAKGVGEYTPSKESSDKEKSMKLLFVKNIFEYNSNTNSLQAIKPIITTDVSTQQIKKTPVRKLINIEKASIIYNGKILPKTSISMLKDKELTIIFRQNRDKKTKDKIEELDAITVIAR